MAEHILHTLGLGKEEEFEAVAKTMVLECKINEHGQLLNKYNWLWCEPYPPDIAENMLRLRNETVKRLLDIPYTLIKEYELTNDNICKLGDIDGEDNACDGLSWGRLTRGMQLAGLWPIKAADEVYLSLDEVVSAVQSIHVHHFVTHHNRGPANLDNEVAQTLQRIEKPVLEIHKRHLAAQRALIE